MISDTNVHSLMFCANKSKEISSNWVWILILHFDIYLVKDYLLTII